MTDPIGEPLKLIKELFIAAGENVLNPSDSFNVEATFSNLLSDPITKGQVNILLCCQPVGLCLTKKYLQSLYLAGKATMKIPSNYFERDQHIYVRSKRDLNMSVAQCNAITQRIQQPLTFYCSRTDSFAEYDSH
jgi:hypothetical protein